MDKALLAIDVGGSTTRAYLVQPDGRCLGYGRSSGGNPASNNPDFAAASMISAVEAAVADAGGGPFDVIVAQVALAGPQVHVALGRLEQAFRSLGLSGPILFAGDVLAMFASVTLAAEGYCVIAGTGSGATRIRGGEIERVVDLAGWLLGDLGSGYWLGHEAAKAVVAHMEGRGDATALTPLLLDALDVTDDPDTRMQGRPMSLRRFIDAVYAMRPIDLARLAPLVVANRQDAVAARLIGEAETHLVDDFRLAFDPDVPGPVVLGGGVIAHLPGVPAGITGVLHAAGHAVNIRTAADGSIGAIVLALRAMNIAVDGTMFETITNSVTARSTGTAPPASA
jgi:N-acetylglucosamine kinase-like BadF-type ATPase